LAQLRPLYRGEVADEEIDHLGHMNVRFYLQRALQASRALARQLGLEAASREMGAVLAVRDLFTRHFREQLAGAPLVVMGGVLGSRAGGLRFYHELRNPERDELAASFLHDVRLEDADTRQPMPLPESTARRIAEAVCPWPERGRPRTLDVDAPLRRIELDEARARGLAMREPRRVEASECDDDGVYRTECHQDLVWGGMPIPPREPGMPLYELSDGRRFGWATLESRSTIFSLPRVGTLVQSFGAEVEIARKTSVRHQWVFDLERGTLLSTGRILNLAFDIGARRATLMPDEVRESLQRQHHPDLL
jgi:acyl-CoA thioester hydrolase